MESPLDIYEEIGSAGREKRTALWVKEQRLTSVWCPEDSISIDLRSLEAIDNYKRIEERIAKDKGQDLSIVLNAITSVMSSKGDPRFIVLENSSGTGKTQMAFNLQTSGSCDVFYLPCAKAGDDAQLVYKAFSKRTVAFLGCINEAAEKLNEGSVAEFYGAKELRLYAFIVAALRGDESFRGPATRLEVEQAFREKKKSSPSFFSSMNLLALGHPMLVMNGRSSKKDCVW
ncbi:hypothetical protein PPTG_05153 [Phytophthora nicotianae INRA-310]|uniref:Uncharacterized protein n=1 Tax=Phytophthora nicotianae (strain INRA-310) TaxID=761204 RepID=W2QWP3_PHYN3|nr:hypothetical protein PPTG_05153 [Phytophthora nicotianae INRA-310]ETN17326.1 hypothetical protein PPTG_05153 [Phytophthora nicotianae INRA-310]